MIKEKYKELEKVVLNIEILQLQKQISQIQTQNINNELEQQIRQQELNKKLLHKQIIELKAQENYNYDNQIINDDCLNILPYIKSDSIDLFLSDIPYGINLDEWDVIHKNTNSALLGHSPAQEGKSGFKKRGKPINGWNNEDKKINKEYEDWCFSWALMLFDIMKEGAPVFIFGGRRTIHAALKAMERAGFLVKDVLAWEKKNAHHRSQDIFKVLVKRGKYKLDKDKLDILQDIIGFDYALKLKQIQDVEYNSYKSFIEAINEIDKNLKKKYEYEILEIALNDEETINNVKKWKGWKLGNLAPIYEPVAWLFKPYSSVTLTDNLLKNNVGAMNINECKIDGKSPTNLLKFWFNKDEEKGLHEAQKPISLMEYLIKLTTLQNQTVLDCFVGSGTTAVAAKNLQRKYIAIERNKEIYDIACKRLNK